MAVLNPGPLVGSIPSEGASLHAVGRYGSLGDAEEDGLAILAMGEAYWTFRDGDYFILCVEPSAVTAVEEELRASRKLRRRRFPWQKGSDDLEVQSFGVTSFLVVGALIVVFFRNYSGPLQPGLTGRPGHSRALWSVGVLECWSLNIGHHYSALRLSGIELRNKRIAMEQTGQGIHGTNSIFAGR